MVRLGKPGVGKNWHRHHRMLEKLWLTSGRFPTAVAQTTCTTQRGRTQVKVSALSVQFEGHYTIVIGIHAL